MGLLRLLLACTVVIGHLGLLGGLPVPGPDEAVRVFFAISGFYMAGVIAGYRSGREFLLARALRICPPYFVVLFLALAWTLVAGCLWGRWGALSAWHDPSSIGAAGRWLATATNFTLVGQDLVLFLEHRAGDVLRFTADFRSDTAPLHSLLLVPQAWSVSLELGFYALTPWLLSGASARRWWVLGAAVAIRLSLLGFLGWSDDPWRGRFFPSELGWFVAGALVHQLASARPSRGPRGRSWWIPVLVLSFAFLGGMSRGIPRLTPWVGMEFLPMAGWLPLLPLAWGWTRDDRFDRRLGELSFPLYLVHMLVLQMAQDLFGADLGHPWLVFGACLVAAFLFEKHLVRPLEARRKSLARRWAGP